jgi:hypothetical protein
MNYATNAQNQAKAQMQNRKRPYLPAPLLPRLACSRGAAGDRLRRPDRETCALPRHNNDSRATAAANENSHTDQHQQQYQQPWKRNKGNGHNQRDSIVDDDVSLDIRAISLLPLLLLLL